MLVFFTWNGFNRFLLGLKWAYWGYRRNSRRKDDSTVICFHFKSTLVQLALAFYFSGLQIMRDSELKPLLFDCQWVRQSTCFPRKDSPSEPLPTGNEWMNERMNGWKKKRRRHLEGFAQWIVAKEGRPGGGVGDCRFHDNRATPAPTTSTSNGFEWRHRRSVRSLINCLGSQRHRVPRRHGKWVGDLPSTHTHTHTHTYHWCFCRLPDVVLVASFVQSIALLRPRGGVSVGEETGEKISPPSRRGLLLAVSDDSGFIILARRKRLRWTTIRWVHLKLDTTWENFDQTR